MKVYFSLNSNCLERSGAAMQHVIDTAIYQWRCQLTVYANAKGGHFEQNL